MSSPNAAKRRKLDRDGSYEPSSSNDTTLASLSQIALQHGGGAGDSASALALRGGFGASEEGQGAAKRVKRVPGDGFAADDDIEDDDSDDDWLIADHKPQPPPPPPPPSPPSAIPRDLSTCGVNPSYSSIHGIGKVPPATPPDYNPLAKPVSPLASSAGSLGHDGQPGSQHLFPEQHAAALARRRQKEREKREAARLLAKEKGQRQLQAYGLNSPRVAEAALFAVPAAVPEKWTPDKSCSAEQLDILRKIRSGRNIFFSGPAGTGKSFVLGQIKKMLEAEAIPYAITSPTGISALQIGGMTIHSWARVGLGADSTIALLDKIINYQTSAIKWTGTAVLIIDEISMLQPSLFTKLNIIGKAVRNDPSAFGGIQLIVSGDFFQLPPVGAEDKCLVCNDTMTLDNETYRCIGDAKKKDLTGCGATKKKVTFSFQTETWAECNFEHILLNKVFRQADPVFARILKYLLHDAVKLCAETILCSKVRRGVADFEVCETLQSCNRAIVAVNKIKPTRLEPKNANVDGENRREYAKLGQVEEHVYNATDGAVGWYAEQVKKERLKAIRAPAALSLKEGAQVMLLANLDLARGLANGSRGVIVGFEELGDDPGAESHRPNTAGDVIRAAAERDWFDQQLERTVLPRVLFTNGHEEVLRPWVWTIDVDKKQFITRCQLPLALAWAVTIHKCQGSTLDAVTCNLSGVWDCGQAYVALSRCRTLDGMKVEGFSPGSIRCSPEVKRFYANLPPRLPNAPVLLNVIDFVMPPEDAAEAKQLPAMTFRLMICRPNYRADVVIPDAIEDATVQSSVDDDEADEQPSSTLVSPVRRLDTSLRPKIKAEPFNLCMTSSPAAAEPTNVKAEPIDLTGVALASPAKVKAEPIDLTMSSPMPIEESKPSMGDPSEAGPFGSASVKSSGSLAPVGQRPLWQQRLCEAWALAATYQHGVDMAAFLAAASTVTTEPLQPVDVRRKKRRAR